VEATESRTGSEISKRMNLCHSSVLRSMRTAIVIFLLAAATMEAQYPTQFYSDIKWRSIGPFRGGRTVAAAGIPDQPNVFYVAAVNGGIWKSIDAGRVWKPIFDDQDTGSIGSLAIAPSNPNVIYAGSGEGLQRPDLSVGDGIYRSGDGGKTWAHLGLRDGWQIPAILVDPQDENRLFVAVLGHPYGPNTERGIYRSTDGGQHFDRVLYKDENTGGMDLAFDPKDPRILYADLWAGRQAPWEIGGSFNGPGSGLFKSMDGGTSWKPLTNGLPGATEGLGRIGIGVAPSDGNRIYAMVDADKRGGVYRSDNAGESWTFVDQEERIWGRGSDFACVRVDPRNPDRIYVANTSTYRSDDAGKTYMAIKGAPGGDDYHTIWINPLNPSIILLAVDQGATLTVDGGQTWSSWYNQSTAQFYHVITDNQFPYWVYGGQQESGSVGIASRSDYGSISFRDWHPVGVEEYGYVAPDPLSPNLIYGGKVTRFDQTTGDIQNVGPVPVRSSKFRFVRTMPLLFSPVDPHVLYLGSNVVFKTTDGGNSWVTISPDLTRDTYEVPSVLGVFAGLDPEKGKHRGVIYTIAPSPKDASLIWCGTDDGSIHVTRDGGKNWTNVTPLQLTPWSKVSLMEASHFEEGTAYAAVNRFRLDDLNPHIYRTRDSGKNWVEVTAGLPRDAPINVIREDPLRRGLLYAGSEHQVWVSFDDGDNWGSLRLNMPVTSIRDLVVHGDDLVVGTHGRGFWIADDITPLRHMQASVLKDKVTLFEPQTALRWRWNRNPDTPLPPEEPVGQNPPDGAIIDYYLQSDARQVAIEILTSSGALVRRYASSDALEPIDPELNVPTYWIRPAPVVATNGGMHRFVWDLRYSPPKSKEHEYPISAIYKNTPRLPVGPSVLPGEYRVRLVVDGESFEQPLRVKLDPRIKTSAEGLKKKFDLSIQVVGMMNASEGKEEKMNRRLGALLSILEDSDAAPTTQAEEAVREMQAALKSPAARAEIAAEPEQGEEP
jgi:photosystem II stability/assembly factor-like uncharacterized protein